MIPFEWIYSCISWMIRYEFNMFWLPEKPIPDHVKSFNFFWELPVYLSRLFLHLDTWQLVKWRIAINFLLENLLFPVPVFLRFICRFPLVFFFVIPATFGCYTQTLRPSCKSEHGDDDIYSQIATHAHAQNCFALIFLVRFSIKRANRFWFSMKGFVQCMWGDGHTMQVKPETTEKQNKTEKNTRCKRQLCREWWTTENKQKCKINTVE